MESGLASYFPQISKFQPSPIQRTQWRHLLSEFFAPEQLEENQWRAADQHRWGRGDRPGGRRGRWGRRGPSPGPAPGCSRRFHRRRRSRAQSQTSVRAGRQSKVGQKSNLTRGLSICVELATRFIYQHKKVATRRIVMHKIFCRSCRNKRTKHGSKIQNIGIGFIIATYVNT